MRPVSSRLKIALYHVCSREKTRKTPSPRIGKDTYPYLCGERFFEKNG